MKQQLLHAESVLYALVCGPMWLWPLPLPSGDHFRSVFGDKAGWAQAVSWWLSAWGDLEQACSAPGGGGRVVGTKLCLGTQVEGSS